MKTDKKFFEKLTILFGVLLVGVSIPAFYAVSLIIEPQTVVPSSSTQGIFYASDVSVTAIVDGEFIDLTPGTNPNFFTGNGSRTIMHFLGTGQGSAVNQIAICNGSATNGSLILQGALADPGNGCYLDAGLTNATGTFLDIDPEASIPAGNWSISNTFTSTADNKDVNATGLLNGSTTGSVYFANNTFNTVTLNTDDTLTIRWNLSVS